MSITTYSTNKLPKLILFQERAKERISRLDFLKNRTTSSQFGTNFSGNEIYQERKILHILLNNNKKHFFETASRTIMWIVRRKRLVQNETTHHDFKYVRKKQVCHYQIPIPFAVQFHRLPTNDPKGTEKSRS